MDGPLRFALGAIAAVALAQVSCTSRGGSADGETGTAQCSNGADDDEDGLFDCDDPSCRVYAWCAEPRPMDAGLGSDTGPPITDTGPLPDRPPGPSCGDPLDVVFVLDVSTSMSDEAARMRDGIASIWTAAQRLTTNLQFGLVVFVDDALAVGGCAPFADAASLQSEFDRWRAFCSSNRSPMSETQNIDCPENSLDALWLAATTCPWRAGATRVIVHVTDDTFVERPAVLSGSPLFGGGVPVQHTYAEVAAALVERELRVGAFAAPGAGEFCGAGSSPNVGQGFHEPYRGMRSLPEQTGGRAYDIRAVRAGMLDMAAAITDLLADEYCTLF